MRDCVCGLNDILMLRKTCFSACKSFKWQEGNTLVIQYKLKPLDQSGHMFFFCRRSGCGLLFPKKCVSHTPSHCFCQYHVMFQLNLLFPGCVTKSLTGRAQSQFFISLVRFFCFCLLIQSLCIYLLF